jgi:hypothetical protein
MPAPRTKRYTASAPYPGLRPFDVKDAFLFFGREQHTSELLDRLARNRLLAVVGTSGSGKSSLVRAGLLPALYRGYMAGATTRWRIAVMRPGAGPLDEAAAALSHPGALGGSAAAIREMLGASTLGLVSAAKSAGLEPGESLLLVVDQFEEIFRFAADSRSADPVGEALLFVTSLLEAADQFETPVYVVLTMRTDYIGDCTVFPGLPEALNRSQYLVPRPTREQLRDAIEKPLELFDASITPRLLQQVLNDMGNDPDQLPVMQHAMARMYRLWKAGGGGELLDLDDYAKAGSLESALNDHAEALYAALSPSQQEWARKLFRCLTKTERGRRIRRAGRLERIFRVIGAGTPQAQAEVMQVVEVFAREENCFLYLAPGEREADRILDITHESLIRKWRHLTGWVKDEAFSAEQFTDLLRDTARQQAGETRFIAEPELGRVMARQKADGWTEAWAEQYAPPGSPTLADVQQFLAASQKRARWRTVAAYGVGVFVLALIGMGWLAVKASLKAKETETALANMRKTISEWERKANETTDAEQKRQFLAQAQAMRANLGAPQSVEALQQQNSKLQAELDRLGKIQAASTLPPGPAKAVDDPHLVHIAELRRQLEDRVPRSEHEEQKRLNGQLAKELTDMKDALGRAEATVAALQARPSVPTPTSTAGAPRTEPTPVVVTNNNPGQPARVVVPPAPSSARKTLVIKEDSAVRLEDKGITLLLKHMGGAPAHSELFVLAGRGSPELRPFESDRAKADAYIFRGPNKKRALPSCDGASTAALIDGYQVWCLNVDNYKVDKKKHKIFSLPPVTVNGQNLLFSVPDYGTEGPSWLTVSVSAEAK